MRSDFVSLVAGQPQMQALIEQAIEPVTPLSAPELRRSDCEARRNGRA